MLSLDLDLLIGVILLISWLQFRIISSECFYFFCGGWVLEKHHVYVEP